MAVRAALAGAGDPERAAGQQAYMKSSMPYRGLTSGSCGPCCGRCSPTRRWPRRRGRPGRRTCGRCGTTRRHREERYAALAVTAHRAARPWQDPEALGLYRHLVETGAWWDYVDLVAADRVGPILLRHRPIVTPMMRADAVDAHLWVRRTAILAQLKHREETDLDLLSDVIDANLEGSTFGSEFFIRKAIGWALRQHARVDPDWVRAFVEARGDRLSGLSRREALKHL